MRDVLPTHVMLWLQSFIDEDQIHIYKSLQTTVLDRTHLCVRIGARADPYSRPTKQKHNNTRIKPRPALTFDKKHVNSVEGKKQMTLEVHLRPPRFLFPALLVSFFPSLDLEPDWTAL